MTQSPFWKKSGSVDLFELVRSNIRGLGGFCLKVGK